MFNPDGTPMLEWRPVYEGRGAFAIELLSAAIARREKGDCGPFATGEENDLVAYEEVQQYLADTNECDWDVKVIARECSVPEDFASRAIDDVYEEENDLSSNNTGQER